MREWLTTGRQGRRVLPALVIAFVLAAPADALAFGTLAGTLGQSAEHEKVTRSLQCVSPNLAPPKPADLPGRCWEPGSMTELAGRTGTLGAVGAPDIDSFFEDAPHCTNGDFFQPAGAPPYPRTAGEARLALRNGGTITRRVGGRRVVEVVRGCRQELKAMFDQAVTLANRLVDAQARIIPAEAQLFPPASPRCKYIDISRGIAGLTAFDARVRAKFSIIINIVRFAVPGSGAAAQAIRNIVASLGPSLAASSPEAYAGPAEPAQPAKCGVIRRLGRMLHGMEDFYAHSNWTDLPDTAPRGLFGRVPALSIHNPWGLRQFVRVPLLNMLAGGTPTITPRLMTPCYDLIASVNRRVSDCARRVEHDQDLGKDKGTVNVFDGPKAQYYWRSSPVFASGRTPRGRIANNFEFAVFGAVRETRGVWRDFGIRLFARYGAARATQMICAITHDDPVHDCNPAAPEYLEQGNAVSEPRSSQASAPQVTTSSAAGTATFTLPLSSAGSLVVQATARIGGRARSVFRASRNVARANTVRVTLRLRGVALRVLRARGRLLVGVRLSYRPRGAKRTGTTLNAVTLRLRRR